MPENCFSHKAASYQSSRARREKQVVSARELNQVESSCKVFKVPEVIMIKSKKEQIGDESHDLIFIRQIVDQS